MPEDAVDERVGAGVCAGEEVEELLHAVVYLLVRVLRRPEPEDVQVQGDRTAELCYKAVPRFGDFCPCSCFPLLPGFACSIHATWG